MTEENLRLKGYQEVAGKGFVRVPAQLVAGENEPPCPKTVANVPRASGEPEISEKELQTQLCQLLRLKGVTALTPRFGKRTRMTVAWPDITFAWKGKPCLWEVKVGSNKCTDEQHAMLVQLALEGWCVAEIRSMTQAFQFLSKVS